jgi:hypothetical protein
MDRCVEKGRRAVRVRDLVRRRTEEASRRRVDRPDQPVLIYEHDSASNSVGDGGEVGHGLRDTGTSRGSGRRERCGGESARRYRSGPRFCRCPPAAFSQLPYDLILLLGANMVPVGEATAAGGGPRLRKRRWEDADIRGRSDGARSLNLQPQNNRTKNARGPVRWERTRAARGLPVL